MTACYRAGDLNVFALIWKLEVTYHVECLDTWKSNLAGGLLKKRHWPIVHLHQISKMVFEQQEYIPKLHSPLSWHITTWKLNCIDFWQPNNLLNIHHNWQLDSKCKDMLNKVWFVSVFIINTRNQFIIWNLHLGHLWTDTDESFMFQH